MGDRTVVSGIGNSAASGTSLKPTTAISSPGTRPEPRMAPSAPIALKSLTAKIAVGVGVRVEQDLGGAAAAWHVERRVDDQLVRNGVSRGCERFKESAVRSIPVLAYGRSRRHRDTGVAARQEVFGGEATAQGVVAGHGRMTIDVPVRQDVGNAP